MNIILLHRVFLLYFLSMSTAAEGARDIRKTRLSIDERRISFGRHTKLSFGGRELAERTAGGRRFTEGERIAALEQLKIAHEKDVRNYRGIYTFQVFLFLGGTTEVYVLSKLSRFLAELRRYICFPSFPVAWRSYRGIYLYTFQVTLFLGGTTEASSFPVSRRNYRGIQFSCF
jgi:hypothetical protein